ncbi:thioesterase II family protein [Alteromonas sp. ASW11-130]|uniref:thioesterase II family protein n=1 Tax=Alteromonas sp. ASW11-130 TaxID=3015775 RepID=UPI0022418D2E|nr:alpha/beta fold hydrolase [Alteromonas sp. ASW11-130]MCW8092491.1 alpha/beta fold hydrolase [Alteromonas sp. ASW11-130]
MEKVQLVCLPFAGGGASFFNEWQLEAKDFDIYGVQLPGREKRFMEPAYTCAHEAAKHVVELLEADTDSTRPTLIFGHSLGAVLAFEVTRLLEKKRFYPIVALVVSGSPDPWTQRDSRASDAQDDDEFIKKVLEFSGYAHAALEEPMMRELLLPTLRADVQMHENYAPLNTQPVQSPVLVLRGDKDSLVSANVVEKWQSASEAEVRFKELCGGHMYFTDKVQPLLDELREYAAIVLEVSEGA